MSAMFSVTVYRVVAITTLGVAGLMAMHAPAQAAAATASSSPQTIYRCDMPGGAVIFADARCKGAAKIQRWQPTHLPMGIQRTSAAAPAMSDAHQNPADKLMLGKQDPYVDCKERGGKFHLTQRLCILPSKEQFYQLRIKR